MWCRRRSARPAPGSSRRRARDPRRSIGTFVTDPGEMLVRDVLAQMQVVDRRDGGVERLVEVRPAVPEAEVAVLVLRAHAPVEDVVLQLGGRGERRARRHLVAADPRARGERVRGVDLDLVAGGARDRRPREAIGVDLDLGREVGRRRRRSRRPVPLERGDGRRLAAVALGIDRRHGPVVRARGERLGRRHGGRGRLDRLRARADVHQRAHRRIRRHAQLVLGRVVDGRPRHLQHLAGIRDDVVARRREQVRRRHPGTHDLAALDQADGTSLRPIERTRHQ